MKTQLVRNLLLLSLNAALVGCVYNWSGSNETTAVNADGQPMTVTSKSIGSGQPLGGYIEQYMDANDKIKLSRGMDGAPGKATSWSNPVNGAEFSVTPIEKVAIDGARYCRSYRVTMTRQGAQDQVNGTACIRDDGTWHTV
jgi:surface antigen